MCERYYTLSSEKFSIKHLIFKNNDRLSRNLKDLIRIQELIEKRDYSIHFFESYQEINKNSDYSTKWNLELLILVAKRHSDKISHDIRVSNKFKISKGIALTHPIGYKYDKTKRSHVIDIDKESGIRWIFDEFDSGTISLSDLVVLVNSNGIKTKNGMKWTKSTIYDLLTNPFYHGEFYSRKDDTIYKGEHEPFYNKDRFLRRVERLQLRSYPRKDSKKKYLLSNLVRCKCGSYYYGDCKKDKYVYYEHPCRSKDGKQVRIREEFLFDALDKIILSLRLCDDFSEYLKGAFKNLMEERTSNKDADQRALSRKKCEIENKMGKLLDLYADDEIDRTQLDKKISSYREEINVLERRSRLLAVEQVDLIITIADVIDDFKRFPEIYQKSKPEDKAKLLKQCIHKIEMDGEVITIHFKDAFKALYIPEIYSLQEEFRVCPTMLPRQDSNLRPSG